MIEGVLSEVGPKIEASEARNVEEEESLSTTLGETIMKEVVLMVKFKLMMLLNGKS